MKTQNLLYPKLAAIIGSLLLLITLILPFASAKEDYKERLMRYPDYMHTEEADMTNKDAVNVSLVEFIRIDYAAAKANISEEVAIANMVIIIAFIVFAVLTLLFSILKKPISTLIFDIISFLIIQLLKYDYKDRGVIPSSSYDWGIAHIVCYIGIAIVAVSAVLLIIVRIKSKRSTKTSEQNI